LGQLHHAAFSPQGSGILTSSEPPDRQASEAGLWDAATGQPVTPPMLHYSGLRSTRPFSPDGRLVALVRTDGTAARVWDATTGQPVSPPLQHGGILSWAAFSPDGRRVLTEGRHTVRVWDAFTGEPVTPYLRAEGANATSFSPDGRRLLGIEGSGWIYELLRMEGGATWVYELAGTDQPLDDLLLRSQALSVHVIDEMGGYVPVETATLRSTWTQLQARHPPEGRAAPTEQALAWHWETAEECERAHAPLGAIRHLDRLIEAAPAAGELYAQRGRTRTQISQWNEAVEDFSKAIDLEPKRPEYWQYRGDAFVEIHQWDKAATDFSRAIQLDLPLWREAALAHLQAGQVEEYRRLCARLLESGQADAQAAWVFALAPRAVRDLAPILRLVEKEPERTLGTHVSTLVQGAVLYRAGRLKAAVQKLQEAIKAEGKEGQVLSRLFLAMAHQRLGNKAKAREFMDQAVRSIDAETARVGKHPVSWLERAELQVLRREAEALLAGAVPDSMK
jgi:tetratricopeptide (TPR) repeat protein